MLRSPVPSPPLRHRPTAPTEPVEAAAALNPAARVLAHALDLGFHDAGIAAALPLEASRRYEAWLAAGRHGEMAWLASRNHRVMRDKLRVLSRAIEALLPGSRALWYSDTGAILERAWAERAGLGWVGKHSGLLSRRIGSWFLLGEVLVNRELEPAPASPAPAPAPPAAADHCGTCTRCLDFCPTGAIVAPREVDARRCISYLRIEHRGAIPMELRAQLGDWIFGCDLCQDVCPWNRFAPETREPRLEARSLEGFTLARFLELDEAGFAALFDKSPVRRTGRDGFLRNVCVALGNRGDASAIPALTRAMERDPSELVRAHAAWALEEIAHHRAGAAVVR